MRVDSPKLAMGILCHHTYSSAIASEFLVLPIVIYWNTARLDEAAVKRKHAGLPVVLELLRPPSYIAIGGGE